MEIEFDPAKDEDDAPELTAELLAQAVPLEALIPDLYATLTRARGRPRVANPKINATLRLDADVISAYRAMGRGWQKHINDLLRAALPQPT